MEDFSGLSLLLDPAGYELSWVASESDLQNVLERRRVDLLICNTRLLDVDGGRWLEELIVQSCNISVIILDEGGRGNAGGGIGRLLGLCRHIISPSDSDQFFATIEQLNEQRISRQENIRLEQRNRTLVKELSELSSKLENAAHEHDDELLEAHRKLKRSFLATIRMFSNLLEWRGGALAGHSRRVADLTR